MDERPAFADKAYTKDDTGGFHGISSDYLGGGWVHLLRWVNRAISNTSGL